MLKLLPNTPIWVYALFVVLLCLSIRACFPREVNTRQSIIFPLVFVFLSILNFHYYPHMALTIPAWAVGVLTGTLLSRYLFHSSLSRPGKKMHTLVVPGSYATLIILLSYFFLRYYLGYQEAIRGGVLGLAKIQLILFFSSSGFTTGFFIIRALLLRKCYTLLCNASN